MDSENIEIKVLKKKRGRKPKNVDGPKDIKIPKKRGRKPTGKIIKLKSNEMSSLSNDENCIIAHIPLNQSDINKISNLHNKNFNSITNYDDKISSIIDKEFSDDDNSDLDTSSINEISLDSNSLGNKKKNFDDKYINHLEKKINDLKLKIKSLEDEKNSSEIFFGDYSVEKLKSKIFVNQNNKFILNKKTDLLCWWCGHKFDNTPFPLPEKYYDNKFFVFGNFCSPSCACAYNIDINDHKLWERNSLILKLANELVDEKVDNIYPAPPKQILMPFGGNITIDEFRKKAKKIYSSRFIIPPMVPLTTLIEESYKDRNKYKWETKVNISKYNNLKKNIKIKRSNNSKNDNNLEKVMGLKKIKIDS
tara:strand:+ start:615 stop:1703 length:1089 start_codon:yes stop_codon:yes gene_type:complete